MKFLKVILLSLFLISLFSCGSDDDICIGGEATPRLKMKFKTQSNGKLKTMDSLYIKVDYGSGPVSVVASKSKIDSVTIPLRVDDQPFTKIFVGTAKDEITSEVKITYTTVSEYVSPACGIKKIYDNVNGVVEVPNAVVNIEKNQNQIIDESKTHFFLLF